MDEAGFDQLSMSAEDWAAKKAQFLYDNGFTGEIISDAEALTRSRDAETILNNAFGIENADTINKLSQTQSLVSALISDITNL
jgi:hypothetical protein